MELSGITSEQTKDMDSLVSYVTNTFSLPEDFDKFSQDLTDYLVLMNDSLFEINDHIISIDSNISDIVKYLSQSNEYPKETSDNLMDIPLYTMDRVQAVNIKKAPTEDDLIGLSNNLNAAVPTGFLLLHNDLVKYLGSNAENSNASSSSSSSGMSRLAGLAGGAIAGLAVGLFKGLFGDKTEKHMDGIIEELNLSMTADDFKDDPDVIEAQREGFLEYLKAYYKQQALSMRVSQTGSAIGEGVANVVTSFLSNTIGKLFGNKEDDNPVVTKMEEIISSLDNNLSIDPFVGGGDKADEVKEIQEDAVLSYLKAYYAVQISEMVAQGAGNTVGNFLGGALGGTLKGIMEGTVGAVLGMLGKREDSFAGSLEKIVLELENKIDKDELAEDNEVKTAQKDSIVNYLKAYYAVQTSELIAKSTGGLWGDLLGGALESLHNVFSNTFGKLFGIKEEEPTPSYLQQIITTLETNVDATKIANIDRVKQAQEDSIVEFIDVYYAAQIKTLLEANESSWFADLAGDLGEGIGNFFRSVANGLTGKSASQDVISSSNLGSGLYNALTTLINTPISIEDIGVTEEYKTTVATTLSSLYSNVLTTTSDNIFDEVKKQANRIDYNNTDVKDRIAIPISNSIYNGIINLASSVSVGQAGKENAQKVFDEYIGKTFGNIIKTYSSNLEFAIRTQPYDIDTTAIQDAISKNVSERLNSIAESINNESFSINTEDIDMSSNYDDTSLLTKLEEMKTILATTNTLLQAIGSVGGTTIINAPQVPQETDWVGV